jgi:hypothetical protein
LILIKTWNESVSYLANSQLATTRYT